MPNYNKNQMNESENVNVENLLVLILRKEISLQKFSYDFYTVIDFDS